MHFVIFGLFIIVKRPCYDSAQSVKGDVAPRGHTASFYEKLFLLRDHPRRLVASDRIRLRLYNSFSAIWRIGEAKPTLMSGLRS